MLGGGGVSQSMTHYDREGVGVRPIMMYDNEREGGSKRSSYYVKLKQEIHKKGDIFARKYKNTLYYCEFG